MKVLHIVSDFGQGGAQTYVCDLLNEQLKEESFTVEVAVLFFKGALWEKAEKTGTKMFLVGMRNALDLPGIARVYRLLKSEKYDIVHVHAIHPGVSALLRWSGALCIYHEHGGGLLAGERLPRLIYTHLYKSYHRFIAISGFMKDYMESINPEIVDRVVVIHNGVQVNCIEEAEPVPYSELPSKWQEHSLAVGVVGRLVAQKGIDTFLEVAAVLALRYEHIVFPIIGDGPLRPELELKAKALGLENSALFMGFRKDAVRIMKRFDAILFTSTSDAFGLVIAEAMAASVPVVALSKNTAVGEIIQDKMNGMIAFTGSVLELAEKVTAVLECDKFRGQLVENARQKVRGEFSMERNAAQVAELYRGMFIQ